MVKVTMLKYASLPVVAGDKCQSLSGFLLKIEEEKKENAERYFGLFECLSFPQISLLTAP
jgi:hypothetical protein